MRKRLILEFYKKPPAAASAMRRQDFAKYEKCVRTKNINHMIAVFYYPAVVK